MNFVGVGGVNGLGKTKGVEKTFDIFFDSCEKLKLSLDDVSKQFEEIYNFARGVDEKCFFVGGDHSISYPLVKGLWEKNKDLKLLVFDAHPDLMFPLKEPTHEEWLRALIEEGFQVENILLVGIRRSCGNIDKREISYLEKKKIKTIFSDEVLEKKDLFLGFLSSGKIYFSLDIDVLDKDVFSCTGYPEKGGLSEKDFFYLLDKAISSKNVCFADLVEVNFGNNCRDRGKERRLIRKILKRFDFD